MRRLKIAQKIGKKIKIERNKKKITQEELASMAKMHVTTLGRIERGESNSPIQTINRISQALRINPKNLF